MGEKKPFALRLSREVMDALQRLVADEYRSTNGQIEYILAAHLRRRGYLGPAQPEPHVESETDEA